MASRHIIASKSQHLKNRFFYKTPQISKPICSFCSITDKPSNKENPAKIEDTICRIMQDDDWSTGLQTSIQKFIPLLNHNLVSSVLNRIPNRALEFFNWVEGYGFKHDRETHYNIISILCRDQRVDDAKKILMGMVKKGIEYDEDLFVLLINGYAKNNKKWDVVKNCVKVFKKMEELGVPKGIKLYNSLFEVIVNNKKYTMAEKFFDKMLAEGVVPTLDTYRLMISGFCRSLRVETADRYFKDMKSRNLFPDFGIYNTMINGYVKVKRMEEAEKVFMEMKGCGIEPLLVTYNAMINGYARVKRLEDAEKILEEMKGRNVEPNLVTYNAMIYGYVLVERMEDARKVVREMKGRNIEPDLVTYVTVVKGYVTANRVDDGLEVVEEMKRKIFGRKVDFNMCLGILKEDCDVEQMSETQRNVLQEVEDYVERVDLLAMRDAARELSQLASQRVVDRRDHMKMDRETRGSDGGSFS